MRPTIKSEYINRKEEKYPVEYFETDDFNLLDSKKPNCVGAYCFYQNKLVIVHSSERNSWTIVSGGLEKGESTLEATIREVTEESNMKILEYKLLGYQKVYEPTGTTYQGRVFCKVEPYGDFIGDPDGDIDEIKLINPSEAKKYFDWREIGDRVLAKALECLEN